MKHAYKFRIIAQKHMYSWNIEKERLDAENYLIEKRSDFVATYMTVSNLQFIIAQHPETINNKTAAALLCVLEGSEHSSQRQAYFLYKKSADALGAILEKSFDPVLAENAKNALNQILYTKKGKPFRAAAEALGAVPLNLKGPSLKDNETNGNPLPSLPIISWQFLMQRLGLPENPPVKWQGRNMIVYSENPQRILVLKMARPEENQAMLITEGMWMKFITCNQSDFIGIDASFQIPEPVTISDSCLFRLDDLPINQPEDAAIDPQFTAIGFLTSPDYFCYPNEHFPDQSLKKETFYEIITRNALLLGRLAGSGIIHTAPIPLFHNRVQRHRRNDGGLYQWPRAGRLDQWLSSCRFPNIGKTGVRDFEHFISFNGSARKLYEFVGSHLFSLILVAGSYFRNRDTERTGLDDSGNPVDARDLFDEALLKKSVQKIFTCYYQGFTGKPFTGTLPRYLNQDLDAFVARLIDEMGVDRHMEEVLRIAEQKLMSDAEFSDFLSDRGFLPKDIRQLEKGKEDITILTGPHLGGFNQQISIPELIEFTAAAAALCISDRYCQDKLAVS